MMIIGTYELEGKDSYNAVTWALEVKGLSTANIPQLTLLFSRLAIAIL